MIRNILYGFIALAFVTSAASCVATKKYDAANSRIASLRSDSLSLENQLAERRTELSNLNNKLEQMKASNNFTTNQLNMSQDEINRQRDRLQQLQTRIDEQRKATEQLRKKMADALVNFNSDQLSVSIKNGRVYVSMQESLLFPSGSAEVNEKGKEALGTLANVLLQSPEINVLVEGHTDSIPIKKRYQDNWALSVARSTEIARILTVNYAVPPQRVTASGRSQYEPIASNATPEGRAQNRRTEIILVPKLEELMQLLNEPMKN